MSNKSTRGRQRLLVMAGGTGGHIFPGVSIAHHLMAQGWIVHWLGSADRLEATLVPKAGLSIDFIKISGIRGRGWRALLNAPWSIFCAVRQAAMVIKQFQPDVVLGLGGYVSGPGGIAAWLAGVPIVVHEQNAIFGLTNRWLAYFAQRILTAFPGGSVPAAEVVGNPVRPSLAQLIEPQQRFTDRQGPLRLLILGGSQGARILNQVVPAAAVYLRRQVIIWHQVGTGAQQSVVQAYRETGLLEYRVNEFIEDMVAAYAWADLVVCRAGALTVSELAVAGLSAILVPFQHADRQQYLNAQVLQRVGAAEIMEESQLTAQRLAQHISCYDRTILLQRAQRARVCARFDATQKVASVLQSVVEQATAKRPSCSESE